MAVVFFGSNFTIVKKYDSGDGIFFQLWMCMGIWTVGLVVNLIQGSPKFWPFAMLGGVLWAIGNVLCVYIIQQIGLGLGLVIWGSTLMLTGWFTGFFGLFGLEKDDISVVWLSVIGLVFALASLLTSFFVEITHVPEASSRQPNSEEGFAPLPSDDVDYNNDEDLKTAEAKVSAQEGEEVKSTGSPKSKVRGIICALCAGFFFGINFDPPTYIQQHNCEDDNRCDEQYRGASSEPLDYVFAHFCGIIIMSMFIFFSYAIYKRNTPWVSPQICLPAYLSGGSSVNNT
eukprot:CAMPEP_0167804630 /NCGR_PEP_ID=MMETSP0111_2-20121227/20611_1 /TAXON_ID=91324 /ORGANISM="Lotharella globosa, Strain CCCM811" /LENGTH=285 /DNA_ID=CAMNT_0007701457 /DNA_START=32 /DNA_END=889 /DNA_ORIENTATION=-